MKDDKTNECNEVGKFRCGQVSKAEIQVWPGNKLSQVLKAEEA